MSEFRVASRYAKALLDLAIEQSQLERVKQDMEQFIAVLKGHAELQAVLNNPIIKHDKKINILNALFGQQFDPNVLSFFKIMINKGRAEVLYGTAQEFIREYNAYKKIISAKVISAATLSDENRKAIIKLINEVTGHDVVLESSVDPELIGGFIVTIGDKQIDASLAGRLNKLERSFLSAS